LTPEAGSFTIGLMPESDQMNGADDGEFERSRERTRHVSRTVLIAVVVFAFLYIVNSAGPFT
jgi:hypothetical protein